VKILDIFINKTFKDKGYILINQLIRSSTSIGANICEARFAYTKRDFLSKIAISYKEAQETEYWIYLLRKVNIIDEKQGGILTYDIQELQKMLSSTILTTRRSISHRNFHKYRSQRNQILSAYRLPTQPVRSS